MNKNNVIFWVSTGLFSAMMLLSGFMYFTSGEAKSGLAHLGFPDYFRIELGTAKLLGALALLIPNLSKSVKLFAYAGFAINLVSAAIAHAASGDTVQAVITPLIFLGVLGASYLYYIKQYDARRELQVNPN